MLKWLLIVLGVVVALGVAIYVVGLFLPVQHTAAVRVRLSEPPERVFATIHDVASVPSWRQEVKSVDVLSRQGEPLRWREVSSNGTLEYTADDMTPNQRFVARINATGEPFGGRWIYTLVPDSAGTILTITEEGEVYSPIFRTLSRFVFGHYGTLESYARDLGTKLGDPSPAVERIGP